MKLRVVVCSLALLAFSGAAVKTRLKSTFSPAIRIFVKIPAPAE